MTDLNKQELRRLAEAAISDGLEQGDRWALNIDPRAIIALLDQCEALHAVLGDPDEIKAEPAADYEALRKQFTSLLMLTNSKCRQAQHWRAQSSHTMHQTILATAANVNAERDTNAILTDALEQAEAERDQLKAEVESLRKDAGRWRLVRSPIGTESALSVWHEGRIPVFSKIADRMADEAIAKQVAHD